MFEQNRNVIYLGEDLALKEKLETSLNVRMVSVSNVATLASEIGDVDGMNLTVIYTPSVSANLKGFSDILNRALETIVETDSKNSVIIELGFESPMVAEGNIRVFRYATADELIEDKFREVRGETVQEAKEKGLNKFVRAYEDFQTEIKLKEEEIEELKTEVDAVREELTRLRVDYSSSKKISDRLESERKGLDRLNYEQENKIIKLTGRVEELNTYLEDMKKEYAEVSSINSSRRYEIMALEKTVKEFENLLEATRYELEEKSELVRKLRDEKDELIHSLSGADKYKSLEGVNKSLEEKVAELEEENISANVRFSKAEFERDRLFEELEALKKDDTSLAEIGRSLKLDVATFKNVNVFYFKIYQELPYFNTYVKKFIELLGKKERYGIVKTAIIKHDEGLDSRYFRGVRLYNNLYKTTETGDSVFRLFPSSKMFLGIEEFEDTANTLVVLDYIQDSTYFLGTDSYYRKFVVVNNSRTKDILGIEGNEISLSERSRLDMNYNREIGRASTRMVKEGLITVKIRDWMDVMEI